MPPVDGIREKLLAARRENLHTIILPYQNESDIEELPQEAHDDITYIFVRHVNELTPYLFDAEEPNASAKRTRAKIVGKTTPKAVRIDSLN